MRHHIGLAVALLALGGCTAAERSGHVAQNPHHACQQRVEFGTPAFDQCIETAIAERCAAQGHPPGAPTFEACDARFRENIFLTQQLEIRGYRLFTEIN